MNGGLLGTAQGVLRYYGAVFHSERISFCLFRDVAVFDLVCSLICSQLSYTISKQLSLVQYLKWLLI